MLKKEEQDKQVQDPVKMELHSNAHTSAKHFHPEWTRSNWLFIQFLTLEVAKWREQIQIYEMDMSSPSMLAKLPEIFDGCQERLERLLALDWLSSNWYYSFRCRIRSSFLIEKLFIIRWLNRFDKAIVVTMTVNSYFGLEWKRQCKTSFKWCSIFLF